MTGQGDDDALLQAEEGESVEALGTVYRVGPTRSYKTLQSVASLLQPGDVVEVDGGATYAGGIRLTRSGTASAPITIRGVRSSGGARPVLKGGTTTIELNGNHTVFEGFDVTGGSSRCVFHHAHAITVRDTVVHDCPGHGVLGADSGSGSLTMDRVEVFNAGAGDTKHPVYIATDESAYPGAVFRMQHSYVHHGNGGNNVKTRAERNEIYYNWIEGAVYKELELIGPDGQDEDLKREDSDVVGNVFWKTKTQFVVRVGGDGTGQTFGRYRFLNNTFVLAPNSSAAIHAFDGIESIELHNNVFYRQGGGAVTLLRDDGAWTSGKVFVGTKNFVPTGTAVPSTWTGTLVGGDPGFTNVAAKDVRPKAGSVLIDKGTSSPASPSGHAFPSPLASPVFAPPLAKVATSAISRPLVGALDLGAYEYGTASATSTSTTPTTTSTSPTPTTTTTTSPTSTCISAPAGQWPGGSFAPKTGWFSATFDVTPSRADVDGSVGLALGAPTTWPGMAAIVRFNPIGRIDVRHGSTYASSTTMTYSAGATYRVRIVVDVAGHRYSVYVTPPGGTETTLASNFAFRTEWASAASLDHWATTASVGSIKTCPVSGI